MKVPQVIKTFCPSCRKHAEHRVREFKKGAQRTLSWGYQKHLRRTCGYTSQVAGKVPKFKQSQKITLMAECSACKKKHPLVLKHAKKKVEIRKKEE